MTGGIEARGVRRTFGDVIAVDDISLTSHYGEITGLVGPNGAGKTTLLLMLATLLTPDAGELTVAGHSPVYEPRAVRAAMGWMPDTFGTYDTLAVREALQFAAAAYGPANQPWRRAGR
jgi:ABC-2 type transport system ATP-binding protein